MSNSIIVLGEIIADIAPGVGAQAGGALELTAHAGGSPANVAVGLARLGQPARFAGRLSRSGLGPFLRAHLEQSGVDLRLSVDASEPPTLAIVNFAADGSATYAFYVEGTADWHWTPRELPVNAERAAIHTGSLACAVEPGAAVVAAWVSAQHVRGDVFVSLDPNVRPQLMLGQPGYRARLEALIGCANLVKVSEDDLRALEPEAEPLVTAASWVERGPELVVVTHGAGGATAVGPGAAPLHVPARRVETVDTIGAGDAFTAGLLTFLAECGALRVGGCAALELQEVAAALVFASDVAAATCARAGADPPWRVELPGAFVSGSNDWRRT